MGAAYTDKATLACNDHIIYTAGTVNDLNVPSAISSTNDSYMNIHPFAEQHLFLHTRYLVLDPKQTEFQVRY